MDMDTAVMVASYRLYGYVSYGCHKFIKKRKIKLKKGLFKFKKI